MLILYISFLAVLSNLREAVQSLLTERDRLKQAVEMDSSLLLGHGGHGSGAGANAALVASLRGALTSALQQNNELKNRLNRIHENSDLSDVSSIATSDQVHFNKATSCKSNKSPQITLKF